MHKACETSEQTQVAKEAEEFVRHQFPTPSHLPGNCIIINKDN